mgnify:CR=1 FL=1
MFLIEKKYDVNAQNKKFDTPLTLAIKSKTVVIIDKLLTMKNVDINTQIKGGFTPLLLAITRKLTTVVNKLLEMKCNYMARLNNGNEFELMIINGYENVAKLYYLETCILENDILDKVIKYKHYELANIMIDNKVKCSNKKIALIIIMLLNENKQDLVKKIFNTYDDIRINYPNKRGERILTKCIELNYMDLAKKSIELGASAYRKNRYKKNAFDISKDCGRNEEIYEMVEKYSPYAHRQNFMVDNKILKKQKFDDINNYQVTSYDQAEIASDDHMIKNSEGLTEISDEFVLNKDFIKFEHI